MKKIMSIFIICCFSFGIGYFAAIDLNKNLLHRRIVDEMKSANPNVIEYRID